MRLARRPSSKASEDPQNSPLRVSGSVTDTGSESVSATSAGSDENRFTPI